MNYKDLPALRVITATFSIDVLSGVLESVFGRNGKITHIILFTNENQFTAAVSNFPYEDSQQLPEPVNPRQMASQLRALSEEKGGYGQPAAAGSKKGFLVMRADVDGSGREKSPLVVVLAHWV